jgi:transcriptional regulator NrdR family protein
MSNKCELLTIEKIEDYAKRAKGIRGLLALNAFIKDLRSSPFPPEDTALNIVAAIRREEGTLEDDFYSSFRELSIEEKRAALASKGVLESTIAGLPGYFSSYEKIYDYLTTTEQNSTQVSITSLVGEGLGTGERTITNVAGATVELREQLDGDVIVNHDKTGFLALQSKRMQETSLMDPNAVDFWTPFFSAYFPANIQIGYEFSEMARDIITDTLLDLSENGRGFTRDIDTAIKTLKASLQTKVDTYSGVSYPSEEFLKSIYKDKDLKDKYFTEIFLLEFDFILENLTRNISLDRKRIKKENHIVTGFLNEAGVPIKQVTLDVKNLEGIFTRQGGDNEYAVDQSKMLPTLISLEMDSHNMLSLDNLTKRSVYHAKTDNKYYYIPSTDGVRPIDISPKTFYTFAGAAKMNNSSIDHHVGGFDNHTEFINHFLSMLRRIEIVDGKPVKKGRLSIQDYNIIASKMVNASMESGAFLERLRQIATESDTEHGIIANSLLLQVFSPYNREGYNLKSIQSIVNEEQSENVINSSIIQALKSALRGKVNIQFLKVEEGTTNVTRKMTNTSFAFDANNAIAAMVLEDTKTKESIADYIVVDQASNTFSLKINGNSYLRGDVNNVNDILVISKQLGIDHGINKIHEYITGLNKTQPTKDAMMASIFRIIMAISATNKTTGPLQTPELANEFDTTLYTATPFDTLADRDEIAVVAKAFNVETTKSISIAGKMTSVITQPSREDMLDQQIDTYNKSNEIHNNTIGFSPFMSTVDSGIIPATLGEAILKSSIVKEGIEFGFSSWDLKIREEHSMIHAFINASKNLGQEFYIQGINYSNKKTPLLKKVALKDFNALLNTPETKEALINNYIRYMARKNEDMQRIMLKDVSEYILGNFSSLLAQKQEVGNQDEIDALIELRELLLKDLTNEVGDMVRPINLVLERAKLSASEVLASNANIDIDSDYITLSGGQKDVFLLKPNMGVRAAAYRGPKARAIVDTMLLNHRKRMEMLGLNRGVKDTTSVEYALNAAVGKMKKSKTPGAVTHLVTDINEFYDRYLLVNSVYGHALKVLSIGDESYFGGKYNYDSIQQYYDKVDTEQIDGLEEHDKMLVTQYKRAQTLLTRGLVYSYKKTMLGFKREQRRDNMLYYAEALGGYDPDLELVEEYAFPKLKNKTISELAGLGVIEPFRNGQYVHIQNIGGQEVYSLKFVVGKNALIISSDGSDVQFSDQQLVEALRGVLNDTVAISNDIDNYFEHTTHFLNNKTKSSLFEEPLRLPGKESNFSLLQFKKVLAEEVNNYEVVLPDVAHSITMEELVSYVDVLNAMGIRQDNSDGVQFIHPLMHLYLKHARGGDFAAFSTEDKTALKMLTTTFEYNKFRHVIGKKSIQYPFSFEQFKKFGSINMYNAFKKMNTAVPFPQPVMRRTKDLEGPTIVANNLQELFEILTREKGFRNEDAIWEEALKILMINQRNMYSFVGYITLPSGQKTGLKKVNPISKVFSSDDVEAQQEVALDQISHEYHAEVLTKDHEYDITPSAGKRSTIKLLSQLVTAISFGGLSTEHNMKLHSAIESTVAINTSTLTWKYVKIAKKLLEKADSKDKRYYLAALKRFKNSQLDIENVTPEIADAMVNVLKASIIDIAERTVAKNKPSIVSKIVRTVSDVTGAGLEDKLSLDGPITKNDVVNALRSALYSDDIQINLPGFLSTATTNNRVVSIFTTDEGTRLSRASFIDHVYKNGVGNTGATIASITADNFEEYKNKILPFDMVWSPVGDKVSRFEFGAATLDAFKKVSVIHAVITPDVEGMRGLSLNKEEFNNMYTSILSQGVVTDDVANEVSEEDKLKAEERIAAHIEYLTKNPIVSNQLLDASGTPAQDPSNITEEEIAKAANLYETYLSLNGGKQPEEDIQANTITDLQKDEQLENVYSSIKDSFLKNKIVSNPPKGVTDVQEYAIKNGLVEVESAFTEGADYANPFVYKDNLPKRNLADMDVILPYNAKFAHLTLKGYNINTSGVVMDDSGNTVFDDEGIDIVENLYIDAATALATAPKSLVEGDEKELLSARKARKMILPILETDNVFIIGGIASNKDKIPYQGGEYTIKSINPRVLGSQGYAAQAAINLNKNVYVYHDKRLNPKGSYDTGWYIWDSNLNEFSPIGELYHVPKRFALFMDPNVGDIALYEMLNQKVSSEVISSDSEEHATNKYLDWVLNGADLSVKNVINIKPVKGDMITKEMASVATKFIGYGLKDSAIENYANQAGAAANTGKYSVRDVVYVKSENTVFNKDPKKIAINQRYTLDEAVKALEAGAVLITVSESSIHTKKGKDEQFPTTMSYADYLNEYGLTQKGEKALYNALKERGYTYSDVEINGFLRGSWTKAANTISSHRTIKEALNTTLKGKEFVNYMGTNVPNSATVLTYLANNELPNIGDPIDSEKEYLFDMFYGEDEVVYLDDDFKPCSI